MASGLTVKTEQRAGGMRAVLTGEITEESNFAAVLEAKPPSVTLDLGGVTRINSTGVREWINFVSALQKNGTRIVLEECSVAIVQQLNMIANFRGGGQVTSVYAPYFCENCDTDHAQLLTLGGASKPDLAHQVSCPKCGASMEFDDLPDTYLSFMDV